MRALILSLLPALLAACGQGASVVVSERARVFEVDEVHWREARRVAEELVARVTRGAIDLSAVRDRMVREHRLADRADELRLAGGYPADRVPWVEADREDNYIPGRVAPALDSGAEGTIRTSARLDVTDALNRWVFRMQIRSMRERAGRVEPFDTDFADRAFAHVLDELRAGLRERGIDFRESGS